MRIKPKFSQSKSHFSFLSSKKFWIIFSVSLIVLAGVIYGSGTALYKDSALVGFRVDIGGLNAVNLFNAYYNIAHSGASSLDIFVPVKTAQEWNSFKSSSAPGFSVSTCNAVAATCSAYSDTCSGYDCAFSGNGQVGARCGTWTSTAGTKSCISCSGGQCGGSTTCAGISCTVNCQANCLTGNYCNQNTGTCASCASYCTNTQYTAACNALYPAPTGCGGINCVGHYCASGVCTVGVGCGSCLGLGIACSQNNDCCSGYCNGVCD